MSYFLTKTHKCPEQNLCMFACVQKNVSGSYWIVDHTLISCYLPSSILVTFPSLLPLAAGIIEAVARDFFDSKVTMVVVSQSEEDERTGKKEHVVFLVKQTIQANETRHQDHSSHSEVSVCHCMCMVCFHMYTSCVFLTLGSDVFPKRHFSEEWGAGVCPWLEKRKAGTWSGLWFFLIKVNRLQLCI